MHINFVSKLLEDERHMMVMIYVDYFKKMVQLVRLQESDAHTVAYQFLSTLVSHHGLPECIMRDHDP